MRKLIQAIFEAMRSAKTTFGTNAGEASSKLPNLGGSFNLWLSAVISLVSNGEQTAGLTQLFHEPWFGLVALT